MRLAIFLTVLASPSAAADICVKNAGSEEFLFAVEAKGGTRALETLAPDARLCVANPDHAGGVVSVFLSADHAEGCSRLVEPPGGMRVLMRYVSFDRCAWDDNNG